MSKVFSKKCWFLYAIVVVALLLADCAGTAGATAGFVNQLAFNLGDYGRGNSGRIDYLFPSQNYYLAAGRNVEKILSDFIIRRKSESVLRVCWINHITIRYFVG
jgi:hypothetical protein